MLAPRAKLWSTPDSAIDAAMRLAELDADDVVYDVGCGDGRVLVRMASMSVPPGVDVDECDDFDDANAEVRSTRRRSSSRRRRHHRCREFVGVEVSEDRAAEARSNVDLARSTGTIPDHVSVYVMCANALDVDYGRATVVFLYLVPRGLRLIRGAVWPTPMTTAAAAAGGGGGDVDVDVDVDDNDRGDGGADRGGRGDGVRVEATTTNATKSPSTMTITDEERTPSKEDEGMSRETATTTRSESSNGDDENINNDGGGGGNVPTIDERGRRKRTRTRRIITYMSPFADTPHVRKEHCGVDHQEGASWPVYLYHCSVD